MTKSTSPPGAEIGFGCFGAKPFAWEDVQKTMDSFGKRYIKPKILRKLLFEKLHKGNLPSLNGSKIFPISRG